MNRPKNKYSIIVAGKSKLGSNDRDDEILKLPHNYGVYIDAWGIDILSAIRHFSAIEDAKKYHKTHSLKKILKELFERYEDVHEEYKQTCKKYKIEEFAEQVPST